MGYEPRISYDAESGDIRGALIGRDWIVSAWVQASDHSQDRVLARCELGDVDVLEARAMRATPRLALSALWARLDGETIDGMRITGGGPPRAALIDLAQAMEDYAEKPECSVCRSRHGLEVVHACE